MALTASEQYLLELINRARLDPAAEAARLGVDLNLGLKPGQIDGLSRQVLAPNAMLEAAATSQSEWMLQVDQVTGTGSGGTTYLQRLRAEGYNPTLYSESLWIKQIMDGVSEETLIQQLHEGLINNASTRVAMFNAKFTESGVAANDGIYTQGGFDYDVESLSITYASAGATRFLTGVAYTDTDGDKFYSMGEGTGAVQFAVGTVKAATAAAGGYSLALGPDTGAAVTGKVGTLAFSLTVDMSPGNVKLDLVQGPAGNTFYTSGSVVLGTGVNNVTQLGLNNLNVTGNAVNNVITGNGGANSLTGLAGNDILIGNAGTDTMSGGAGLDKFTGGKGADVMTGGLGGDTFIFTAGDGNDRVMDFSIAGGDKLRLDDSLWAGQSIKAGPGVMANFAQKVAGEVILDFGDGDIIHLVGLTTVAGLGTVIEVF